MGSDDRPARKKPVSATMRPFFEFVADYSSVTSWAAKAAVAGPLIGLLVQIVPAWPNAAAAGVIAALIEIAVLIGSFALLTSESANKLRRRLRWQFFAGAGALLVFLVIEAFLSFDGPDFGRMAKGFLLKPNSEKLLEHFRSVDEAIKGTGGDATRIWTEGSVSTVRLAFFISWLVFFGFVAGFLATFALLQKRNRTDAERAGKSA